MFSRLQYISQGTTFAEQENNIKRALDNGAAWIQVRWKTASETEQLLLSEKAMRLCKNAGAFCIINDSISIAGKVNADGVHLGLTDESVAAAKAILGKEKIIGGTANSLGDVRRRIAENCDYIGLGPFRFTTTKEKLSPILGLEGYKNIFKEMDDLSLSCPPVYAIGGIALSDIEAIKQTGVYGIALSGLLTRQPQFISKIKNILQ